MSSTQKFEGPELSDLLAQVGKLGAGARVLKAERKRSGGVGGFFSKEWYELTVEVADIAAIAGAAAAGSGATAVPSSIVEMADAVSANEREETFGDVLERVGAGTQLVGTAGMPSAEEFVAAAQARLANLPVVEDAPEPEPVATGIGMVEVGSESLAVVTRGEPVPAVFEVVEAPPRMKAPLAAAPIVLDSSTAIVASQNRAAMASIATGTRPQLPTPTVAVEPSEPVVLAASAIPTVTADPTAVEDARAFVAAATAGLDRDAVAKLVFGDIDDEVAEAELVEDSREPAAFSTFVGDLARRAEEAEPLVAIAGVTTRPRPYIPSTELPSFNVVMQRLAQQSEMPLGDRWSAQRLVASTTLTSSGLVPALLALGVPDRLLLDIDEDELTTLALPQCPSLPTREKSLIAVVGDRNAARRLARALANDLGRGDDCIVMASATGADRWTTEDILVGRGKRRRYRLMNKVVAIGAPAGPNVPWASEILEALEPDMVWGVVDADRKCEDVAAWSRDLGGVDVLALEKIDLTVTPGAILGAGIPVGRIDGEPASPELWADLFTKRLAVAA